MLLKDSNNDKNNHFDIVLSLFWAKNLSTDLAGRECSNNYSFIYTINTYTINTDP